ncbi:hypothetical protein LX36DRAFT_64861 [Colletotrichum falcatum]|nr:hypothetical protein LX36DRAFT_64861 [Colletotrichum falcatum]
MTAALLHLVHQKHVGAGLRGHLGLVTDAFLVAATSFPPPSAHTISLPVFYLSAHPGSKYLASHDGTLQWCVCQGHHDMNSQLSAASTMTVPTAIIW